MPLMDETVAERLPLSAKSGWSAARLMVVAVFGILWLELILQLKGEWWLNPQYNYGLIVPVLVA